MIKDYEIEDGKCVVCGEESSNLPLCKSCYNSYKKFFNDNEDLGYYNKNIRYAMLKLFAYFDLLEDEEIDDDKTGFLINFARMIRPIVQNENNFSENKDKKLIEKLTKENNQLKEKIKSLSNKEQDEEIFDHRKKMASKI